MRSCDGKIAALELKQNTDKSTEDSLKHFNLVDQRLMWNIYVSINCMQKSVQSDTIKSKYEMNGMRKDAINNVFWSHPSL